VQEVELVSLIFPSSPSPHPNFHLIPIPTLPASGERVEHIENVAHDIHWAFPVGNETCKPLEFYYGIETEQNCTTAMTSNPFFHLLEFYIHSTAPLSCRLPSRPWPGVETEGEKPYEMVVSVIYFFGIALPKRLRGSGA
jgi:hypothetical protein